MNFKMIGRFLSQIIAIEAFFMLPALGISFFRGEQAAALAFLYTIGICIALAGLMYLICRKAGKLFGAREGLVCVGFSWVVLSLLGALPFVFSGAIPRYIDALFETISGFTTTGASILAAPASLPGGIQYWRCFSHWLGGMGVLVFLLAIVPSGEKDTGFTMHLLRAESPGPDVGKLVPKMKNTAMILYVIYVAMTFLNFIFLLLDGSLSVLDALCTAFGTAGTGGFGIYNDSFGSCTPYIQWVTTVFMFLFGINFSCYFLLLLRQFKAVIKDEELRLYVGIAVTTTVLIAFQVFRTAPAFQSVADTVRHTAFQVSSIITTTGFSTVDFDQWSAFAKGLLLMLMLTGACAGSTAGGFKVGRLMLVFKSLRRNIQQILNPRKVQVVRINGKPVSETVLANTNAYLAAYMIIIVVSYLVLSLDPGNHTIGTTLSSVLCCFNNIGPGMEAVGPTCNFGHMSDLSKIMLSLDMLAGRLEIFPILVLLSPKTWMKK